MYQADLTQWIGLDALRIAIGFDNVCGDTCGVSWKVDALSVCAER